MSYADDLIERAGRPNDDPWPPTRYVTTNTPWGKADYAYTYGRGVISYGCPGHGGFHLSPTRNRQVHPALREPDGWYEEDCDWAKVAVTFPELFSPEHVKYATESLGRWHAAAWAQVCAEA